MAEQSEFSDEIPAETNELDQHDTKTSIVKPNTNLHSIHEDDEPSKHFRNVQIGDKFETDIMQSDDF